MSSLANQYPKYYDVDDYPVKVDCDAQSKELYATHWDGSPRKFLVTQLDGHEIMKAQYDEAVLTYQKYKVEKSISEKEFKQKISELFGTQFPDIS